MTVPYNNAVGRDSLIVIFRDAEWELRNIFLLLIRGMRRGGKTR